MRWTVRELDEEETFPLRRAVSADGRTDLPTVRHQLDGVAGTWHLGAVDADGRVVATSTYFPGPCPLRPDVLPAVQLAFMAVEPALQRRGIGSAVMAEGIRRLQATGPLLLWANARDSALGFYRRFGFTPVPGSESLPPSPTRPHTIIELPIDRATI